jgi:hypothetical protein
VRPLLVLNQEGTEFFEIGVGPEFELHRVGRLALDAKNAPAEGVDRLLEKDDLGRLQRDLIEWFLSFGFFH